MSGLFDPLLTTPEMVAATSDRAWLDALVRFEAALARASGDAQLATRIDSADLDLDRLGAEGAASASPVVPLVAALRATAGPGVHAGATSQDALDTAQMLVWQHGIRILEAEVAVLIAACAGLAGDHRHAPMAARTLLQPALPTTFGLRCAGWLVGLLDARARLRQAAASELAIQLGGAAGTRAGLAGPEVPARLAAELGLTCPDLPWHGDRGRVAALAAAVMGVTTAAAKVAGDVLLLAQAELGELEVVTGGASSAMGHKRNAAAAVAARAAHRLAGAAAAALVAAAPGELDRGAGDWQAEWRLTGQLLQAAAGTVARSAAALAQVRPRPDRMRANLAAAAVGDDAGGATALVQAALERYAEEEQ